jgi:cytochrome P450
VSIGTVEIPELPGGRPLVGHALQILRRPLEFLERQRAYGDVVMFRLGRQAAYIVNTPETTWDLLVGQGHRVTKGSLYKELSLLGGNGIANSEGDFHRSQRRLIQPTFHRQQIARYTDIMRDVTLEISAGWTDGETVDLDELTHEIAATVASRSLFSSKLGVEVAREVHSCMPILFRGVGRRTYAPSKLLSVLPTPENRRFAAANSRLHGLVDHVIARHRAEAAARDDFPSRLLAARDKDSGGAMTDRQVHDEAMTLLVGATESSAIMMRWVFHMLYRHPRVEERMHSELDQVLAGRAPDFADIAKLEYLDRVITETLRIYPAGWLFTRSPVTDIEIGRYRIPAEANVFCSPYVLHRDPRSFPEPDTFDPDRWLPERAESIPRGAYMPFGNGARKCIGDTFALTELAIVVATLARHWRLRLPPGAPTRARARTTLYPEPVSVILQRRG